MLTKNPGLFHGFFLQILAQRIAQRTKQKNLGSHYTKKSLTIQKIENFAQRSAAHFSAPCAARMEQP